MLRFSYYLHSDLMLVLIVAASKCFRWLLKCHCCHAAVMSQSLSPTSSLSYISYICFVLFSLICPLVKQYNMKMNIVAFADIWILTCKFTKTSCSILTWWFDVGASCGTKLAVGLLGPTIMISSFFNIVQEITQMQSYKVEQSRLQWSTKQLLSLQID